MLSFFSVLCSSRFFLASVLLLAGQYVHFHTGHLEAVDVFVDVARPPDVYCQSVFL